MFRYKKRMEYGRRYIGNQNKISDIKNYLQIWDQENAIRGTKEEKIF